MWKCIDHSNIKRKQYYVSDRGEVKNIISRKILKPTIDKDGYIVYNLPNTNGKIKTYKAHRLVAKSFLIRKLYGNKLRIVNHKNGIKDDNRVSNLEWTDIRGNNRHAVETGLRDIRGEGNGKSVLNNKTVHEICKLMEEGYSNYEIIKSIELPSNGKSKTAKHVMLSSIRHRKTWKHISEHYTWKFND